MKKIYFIQPPTPGSIKISRNCDCASESKGFYMWQPFDFLLLSSKFNPESYEIIFFDGVADSLNIEQIRSSIVDPAMIFVGMADAIWESDLASLKYIFKSNQNTPLFVFGDAFLEESNCALVDEMVDGILDTPIQFNPELYISLTKEEVRSTFSALRIEEKNNFTKQSSTVSTYLPRHELFLKKKYRWPFARFLKYTTVHTAWGCPYSCEYCPVSKLRFILKENESILAELDYIKSLGIKEIYIGDKSFGTPKLKCKSLLREMIERGYNFSWSCYFHPNQFDPELLELMKKSGCHTIIVGIESYNQNSLKQYNRNVKENVIEELLSLCKKLNIEVCADFIFGIENETESDCMRTIEYAKELNIEFASFNILSPVPGTIVRKNAISSGKIKATDHHFNLSTHKQLVETDLLTKKQLLRLRTRAIVSFYLRPRYLLRRLCNTKSFLHFYIQFCEMASVLYKAR